MAWVGVCVSLALSLSYWKMYIFKPALPPYVMLLDDTIIKNLNWVLSNLFLVFKNF